MAVAVEREQVELPDYEKGVGENDERISLVQQPAELAWRRMLDEARMAKSMEEEDISGRVVERAHHYFCFSPPKRDRKLSDEEQQDEAKRPKSPEREGVQLAEEMHYPGFERIKAMHQKYNDQRQVQLDQMQVQIDQMLGSAPAPTAL